MNNSNDISSGSNQSNVISHKKHDSQNPHLQNLQNFNAYNYSQQVHQNLFLQPNHLDFPPKLP